MKIYTKTGDTGQTSLFGGTRVSKNHIQIEAYGTIDELNAWLGFILSKMIDEKLKIWINHVQNQLFVIGSALALDSTKKNVSLANELTATHLKELEEQIDIWEKDLAPLKNFILPAGSELIASIHLARTVCRRAERNIIAILKPKSNNLNPYIIPYINRLSDALFVLARYIAKQDNIVEIIWKS